MSRSSTPIKPSVTSRRRSDGRRRRQTSCSGRTSREEVADAPQHESQPGGSGVAAVADVADALWELERLRLEREWNAIGGLAMPMPAGWDGTDGTDLVGRRSRSSWR